MELYQIHVRAHHCQRFLIHQIKPLSRDFDVFELPRGDKIDCTHENHNNQETGSQPWPYIQAPKTRRGAGRIFCGRAFCCGVALHLCSRSNRVMALSSIWLPVQSPWGPAAAPASLSLGKPAWVRTLCLETGDSSQLLAQIARCICCCLLPGQDRMNRFKIGARYLGILLSGYCRRSCNKSFFIRFLHGLEIRGRGSYARILIQVRDRGNS